MRTHPKITDPKALADFIEETGQLMLRLGYENGFHKLHADETAVILAALRGYVGDQDKLLKAQEHAIACGNLLLEMQSALAILTNACADDGWPRTGEQMAPMQMARAALNKRLSERDISPRSMTDGTK